MESQIEGCKNVPAMARFVYILDCGHVFIGHHEVEKRIGSVNIGDMVDCRFCELGVPGAPYEDDQDDQEMYD